MNSVFGYVRKKEEAPVFHPDWAFGPIKTIGNDFDAGLCINQVGTSRIKMGHFADGFVLAPKAEAAPAEVEEVVETAVEAPEAAAEVEAPAADEAPVAEAAAEEAPAVEAEAPAAEAAAEEA